MQDRSRTAKPGGRYTLEAVIPEQVFWPACILARCFLIIGTPLALGSWYTLALTPVLLVVLYFRIGSEEKVLVRDLVGYTEYQNKVKYRLIPFIW
ncbi:hypothetical protein VSR69_07130 [Paraburkholderia phytofirmans]|uniref:methyltransferase family protein n=1 Tax=Paraburkholderia sp. BL9I2N2 TaxID=1938809 RepID=UPI001053F954|nr:hypothetical protein [Paraburkholderia sp. BL9I2N2]